MDTSLTPVREWHFWSAWTKKEDGSTSATVSGMRGAVEIRMSEYPDSDSWSVSEPTMEWDTVVANLERIRFMTVSVRQRVVRLLRIATSSYPWVRLHTYLP